jgi:hypothetical protein
MASPKVREVHPVEVKVVDEEKEGERTRHASACSSDGRQALPHGSDGLDVCRQLAGSSADKHREYTCMCIREVELAQTHEAPVARLAPRLTAQPLTTKLYARDPLVVVLACRDVAGRPSGNPNVEGAAMSLPADCRRIARCVAAARITSGGDRPQATLALAWGVDTKTRLNCS